MNTLIAPVTNHKRLLVPLLCAILTFVIGFKVLSPVFKMTRTLIKELSIVTDDPEADKTEKKGDNDLQDKKEYLNTAHNTAFLLLTVQRTRHSSRYSMHYISSHYYQITTPPPDFRLPIQS